MSGQQSQTLMLERGLDETDTESQQVSSSGFFGGDDQPRPEIVEGLIREGQFVTFAGPYGMGKSPTLTDLTVHVIRGVRWCGREVSQRSAIAFDFETPVTTYRRNVKNIARRQSNSDARPT